ncbi:MULTISPECIES: ATP-binding protein [Niastella]|uniref:Oxygen sensor histidine kinase NreB n=1 Tax=Niastella soli TaxID=2821487 RepID=A0ABS3YLA2_9BACT|nr:ATP-binding protein [Niastella soli]MBO9198659.1 hypothetical protein [Niastella soli]
MKRILVVTGFILIAGKISAQQSLPLAEKQYADSLMHVLQSGPSDSNKAMAGFLLADYWRSRDTTKSRGYLLQGRQLAGSYPFLKALYHFYEGQFYFNTKPEKAAEAFQAAVTALEPFKTPEAYQSAAAAWYNYALMQRNAKGDSFVTDILLNKSVPLAERSGNVEKLAHFYVQLGTLLMNNARFDKAEIYNEKAIDLLKDRFPGSTTLLFAYLSATSTCIYDSKNAAAKKFLDKAAAMLAGHPESINYPNYYYNEGLYYTAVSQFEKALVSLDKGMVLAERYHQTQLLQMMIFRKYNIYLEQKDYHKAREFLTGLVNNGNLTAEANNRRSLYAQLAKTNELLGDMKEAYRWSASYSRLSDSLHEARLREKIAELEVKFKDREKQEKIEELQEEKTRLQLKAKNSRLFNWLLGTACVLLMVIVAFFWFFLRNQKKIQQLKLTKAMLEGEERERERIARELHDGLGGMLAGIKVNLSGWASGYQNAPQDQELNRIIGQLDTSVSELRHIARNMMPESLLKFGLETALNDLCEFYMRSDLHIEFQAFNIPDSLPLPAQINIYRVVQEVLSNAVRHSKGKHIIVQCSRNGSVFLITVEDDGTGFDREEVKGRKGLGLTNVKNRIDFMKGKLEIITSAGEGTTVNIELHV